MGKDLLNHQSYFNTLILLAQNDEQGKEEDNYSSKLAEDYDYQQGFLSQKLKEMDGKLVQSRKDGRRKIYSVDWQGIIEFIHQNYGEITIGVRRGTNQPQAPNRKDYLDVVGSFSNNELFLELFEQVFINKTEFSGFERQENKPLGHSPLNKYFKKYLICLDNGIQGMELLINNIEDGREGLMLEEEKKQFLLNFLDKREDLWIKLGPEIAGFAMTKAFFQSWEELFNLTTNVGPIEGSDRLLRPLCIENNRL